MSTVTKAIVTPMPPELAQDVSQMVSNIVNSLPYYNERAHREEIAKYQPPQLLALIAEDADAVLAATVHEELAGFCISKYDDGLIWLAWFGVAQPFRNRGVGEALLLALDVTAERRHAHKIWCDSRTENIASQRLLGKFGYVRVGHLTNHWYGQDFYLWEKYPAPPGTYARP